MIEGATGVFGPGWEMANGDDFERQRDDFHAKIQPGRPRALDGQCLHQADAAEREIRGDLGVRGRDRGHAAGGPEEMVRPPPRLAAPSRAG